MFWANFLVDQDFIDHCLELLGDVGPVQARRMFGGHGFYADDVMFALIAYDTLYLRVDDQCRSSFVDAGGEPFLYDSRRTGQPVAMPYYTVPLDAMDDPEAMAPFAQLALAAARRVRAAKKPKRRSTP